MYGPAVRCKRFSSIRQYGLASMYPTSDWSVLCSGPSWISARMRSHYRTGLERGHLDHQCSYAPGRPILHRRLILSQTSAGKGCCWLRHRQLLILLALFLCSCLAAVPSSRPAGHGRAARRGPSRLAVAQAQPLASMLPGHALMAPSTARGLRWAGRHRIGLDAREGAPLVENCPRDAGKLIG